MKIALVYNLKTRNCEAEQEWDCAFHIAALKTYLEQLGHDVWECEVTVPVAQWMPRLLKEAPDLCFNLAEGRSGRTREAAFPTLYEAYGLRYTGSDAYTLTVVQDKYLTRSVLSRKGVIGSGTTCLTPLDFLVPASGLPNISDRTWILKPNYEGSSKGVDDTSVGSMKQLQARARLLLRKYPDGVLCETFIPGIDVTVPWIEGLGVLTPVTVRPMTARARSPHNVYGYRQKGLFAEEIIHAPVERMEVQIRAVTLEIVKTLGLRDYGRVDFRLTQDDELYFIEANSIPSFEYDGAIPMAGEASGYSFDRILAAIIRSAMKRRL